MQEYNYLGENPTPQQNDAVNHAPQNNRSFVYKAKSGKSVKLSPLVWNSIITFLNGILAGGIVSVGVAAYLRAANQVYGPALLALGFFAVFYYGFAFYTNKVGYALSQNVKQNALLISSWLGNMVGALIVGNMIVLTRDEVYDLIYTRSNQLCGYMLADSAGGVLILSIFCGLLMFIAADSFKNAKSNGQKFIMVFLCVMVMAICRFEHSIISVFYFTVADAWMDKSVWYLLITIVGNTLGCLAIPASHIGVKKIRQMAKDNQEK